MAECEYGRGKVSIGMDSGGGFVSGRVYDPGLGNVSMDGGNVSMAAGMVSSVDGVVGR
jgi:hypothetical protein